MEYTEKQIAKMKVKKGEVKYVVAISTGKNLQETRYEVYSEKDWKNEFHGLFDDYSMVEQSLYNYMIIRFRELGRKTKVAISISMYTGDGESMLDECGCNYQYRLIGTYKDGVFKGSVYDSYFEYLDDDDYDGWE